MNVFGKLTSNKRASFICLNSWYWNYLKLYRAPRLSNENIRFCQKHTISLTHTQTFTLLLSPPLTHLSVLVAFASIFMRLSNGTKQFFALHIVDIVRLKTLSSVCSISILKLGAQSVKWFEVHKKIHKMCKAAHARER